MNPSASDTSSVLKELHRDLVRKYSRHGAKVEELWRSFGQGARVKAMKAGAANGEVLKNPTDRSMGNVYKMLPEWNLRDVTEPESDYLLDMLKHRATKTLVEQYQQGDAEFIFNSIRDNGLRHADESKLKYCFALFMDEQSYGRCMQVTDPARYQQTMSDLAFAVNARVCVPQTTGELIMQRQIYLLQSLNIIIEDILDMGSTTRASNTRSKKPEDVARAALEKLSIVPKPEKFSLAQVIASAQDQKSALQDDFDLCCTEPAFLEHVVNLWFFSRPELLQDEKGRILPLHTDKYISTAFVEVIHSSIAGVAVWDYLGRLLQELQDRPNDRTYRGIILQEISNICHFEYSRVQNIFKRYVQLKFGSKYFKRVSGAYDNGVARVTMKLKPDSLTREKPQDHYLLRLCQPENNAIKAISWIKKLDDLHKSFPAERDTMSEQELEAFGNLAVTASFVQALAASFPLPPNNLKKGHTYIPRLKALMAEIDQLKTEIDLSDYAVPIANLLEPGMAEGALKSLDQFIIDKTGTKIGFLYQDLNEGCLAELNAHYEQQKEKLDNLSKAAELAVPSVTETPSPVVVQERKEKLKTRPEHSSIYDITPASVAASSQPQPGETSPVFKVKPSSFKVFSTLFSRAVSRGSIAWADFEAAMANLKFSVMPKFGSVFTFFPPEDLDVQRSLTIHRPHQSRIEGYTLLRFANRLKRLYGWGEQSFEEE
ncbi:hypothetical protein ASPZODRAFT_11979 [Penicilliopsis zonata CBS 506.65]|uniref:Ipa protein n=1 Tax=Penicilliopsis zonata CBS 506.65 TaxID=1073090 RepID=A0A1L9SVG3_9EURO|nr:hypothetical protein ASPZODRAFT_11979 [Penicilliopsis zonata CBS 506.65]OJJ51136.1 hypothetical protein ASPZODRAFT_11979 [Penicilliopsis zonata CBS 506.65]